MCSTWSWRTTQACFVRASPPSNPHSGISSSERQPLFQDGLMFCSVGPLCKPAPYSSQTKPWPAPTPGSCDANRLANYTRLSSGSLHYFTNLQEMKCSFWERPKAIFFFSRNIFLVLLKLGQGEFQRKAVVPPAS